MSTLDEAEYQRLQSAIGEAERLFTNGSQASNAYLGAEISSKKQRVQSLEHEGIFGNESSERRKSDSATAVAVAALVAQENRLNHSERQTYASFLHQEHFTRDDFKKLDSFYADGGAWDRLSERGKKEMSDRIWTGVENGSHSFKELPDQVRKKETDQLANYIKNPEKAPDAVQRMNPEVKEEFIKAHDAGDRESAQKILNSKGLFESSPTEKTQAAAERSEAAASRAAKSEGDRPEIQKKEVETLAQKDPEEDDLSALGDLSVSMTDLPSSPSPPSGRGA